jgi:hypothetical protein
MPSLPLSGLSGLQWDLMPFLPNWLLLSLGRLLSLLFLDAWLQQVHVSFDLSRMLISLLPLSWFLSDLQLHHGRLFIL